MESKLDIHGKRQQVKVQVELTQSKSKLMAGVLEPGGGI